MSVITAFGIKEEFKKLFLEIDKYKPTLHPEYTEQDKAYYNKILMQMWNAYSVFESLRLRASYDYKNNKFISKQKDNLEV